ncbi:MAG: D-alanyl-D-alanine carboxypeptidase/D-alanyl-D-alanine-endopeptidase [Muribaculaceae bacterium]|nr:D-alanyl-D-alanine carboxypeptidase/D-alanyl-D-alanine-endopeptidase [Muribaculaceae bacterium]
MKNRILLTITLSIATLTAVALTPQEAVDSFALDTTLRHASVGVAFWDIDSARMVACHNPQLAIGTASTMKTVTSTAALELLGADYRFHTRVVARGEFKKNKFTGHLIVRGDGDPTLGSRYFPTHPDIVKQVVDALAARGITRVEGQILIDNGTYPPQSFSEDWQVDDLMWYYGAGVHGVNFHDNVLHADYSVRADGSTAITATPPVPGLVLENRIAPDTVRHVYTFMDFGRPGVIFTGTTPAGDYDGTFVNPMPGAMLADSIVRTMTAAGIKFKNKQVKESKLAAGELLLVDHESPALTEIITSLLDRSDNMFTEGLLRALAREAGLRPTDWNGVKQVHRALNGLGVDTDGLLMDDGSGLARNGKATVAFFADMLSRMARRTYGDKRLCDLMPNAGKRIGKLLPETSLATDVVLKSGSMSGVQTFVGYYPAKEPRYVFAILVNEFSCSRSELRDNMDRLLINLFLPVK